MPSTEQHHQVVNEFRDRFLAGERFNTIVEARNLAAQTWGEPVEPGTPLAKATEAAIEQGLVRAGRTIIEQERESGSTVQETYERLIDLYERQPRLATRSSTSILRQQYSTPMPIAYLASRMAGIDKNSEVYEPTAGHGALLMECRPDQVTVNEIDDDRAADLQRQGYTVTQNDAASFRTTARSQDVVITNPPFGRRNQGDRPERFTVGSTTTPISTTLIDHAIAWNALEAMKDDGRAVLILGSEWGNESRRSDKYNSVQNRGFFYNLYQKYNVTEHLTVDGSLYQRQGAGFPIDIIKIEGRGTSKRPLPAAEVPRVYRNYQELTEVLNAAERKRERSTLSAQSPLLGTEAQGYRITTPAPEQLLRHNLSPNHERDPGLGHLSESNGSASSVVDESLSNRSADRARGIEALDQQPTVQGRTVLRGTTPDNRASRRLGGRSSTESLDAPDLLGDRTRLSSTSSTRSRGETRSEGHPADSKLRGVVDRVQQSIGDALSMVESQSGQVFYIPRSQGKRLNTLVPRNIELPPSDEQPLTKSDAAQPTQTPQTTSQPTSSQPTESPLVSLEPAKVSSKQPPESPPAQYNPVVIILERQVEQLPPNRLQRGLHQMVEAIKQLPRQLQQFVQSATHKVAQARNYLKQKLIPQSNQNALTNLAVLDTASKLVNNFGKTTTTGEKRLELGSYLFIQKGNDFSITAKDGRGVILNLQDGKLEGILSQKDNRQFRQIDQKLSHINQQTVAVQPRRETGLVR